MTVRKKLIFEKCASVFFPLVIEAQAADIPWLKTVWVQTFRLNGAPVIAFGAIIRFSRKQHTKRLVQGLSYDCFALPLYLRLGLSHNDSVLTVTTVELYDGACIHDGWCNVLFSRRICIRVDANAFI